MQPEGFKRHKDSKTRIRKQYRSDGISPEERLVITLQFLSQGTSMQALAWTFHIGLSTVHNSYLPNKFGKHTCLKKHLPAVDSVVSPTKQAQIIILYIRENKVSDVTNITNIIMSNNLAVHVKLR
ncbi:hypothetical protein NQ315_007958 [Exocentrus adspersus]|uniref:Transposase n=1 Tax=Exocentrus adspersus TaxID=1586481 RepID=A0AAV8V7E5_9CUCU|nr:hypothetical protein NQ315_007958 [Exocentrus adspersus]